MAKRSKQALAELDESIDQLGGGAPPIPRPRRKAANRKARPAARSAKPLILKKRKKKSQ